MQGRILIVDDDQSMCELLNDDLNMRGFMSVWYTSAEKAFAALMQEPVDVVLTDLHMPGMNGIELCDRIRANHPDIPVVVLTAFGSLDTAVSAIRAGAYDFVTKPIEMEILALTLQRAVNHHALQEKVKILSKAIHDSPQFPELIGTSPAMQKLYKQITHIVNTDASILITGESGTGKEIVARILHKYSRRHAHPFIAINCAALPATLMESELFGYVQGAFTDARKPRKGLILQANQGTLFFDEIGELAIDLQPKLLRAIENSTLRPLGSNDEIAFNVRIIAATNRDLETLVEEGKFREDLFFRINVIQLALPPLSVRGTDILLLAQNFLTQFRNRTDKNVTGISNAAAKKLLNYTWPGNVRELRNAIERAVALTQYEKIVVEDLPEKIRAYQRSHLLLGGTNPEELVPLEEVERRYILHVVKMANGNKTFAARILGIDRKTLHRKLQHYRKNNY